MNWDSVIPTLISSVIGGVVVAVVNTFLTRRKTNAEIKKLEADTDKTRAEAEEIRSRITGLSATVSYKLAEASECFLYDGRTTVDPFDVQGKEGRFWDAKAENWTGAAGQGSLQFENGNVINLRRTNIAGRYEIWLKRYVYNDAKMEFVPSNEAISDQRKVRIHCEAKVLNGEHTLRFVIKNTKTNAWVTNEYVRITMDKWIPIDLYFLIPSTTNFNVRIDDEDVSSAPSSVQIRNLFVTERVS